MEDGGDLWFVERHRELIRRGGENLAPREVEDVLERHPAIAEAAVFAVPDPVWMEEGKAVLVPVAGAQPTAAEIWARCDERLAGFKVPRYLEFRGSIPRTLSGRALKDGLRAEQPVGPATLDRRAVQE